MLLRRAALLPILWLPTITFAQQDMPGMDMSSPTQPESVSDFASKYPTNFLDAIQHHASSGTSAEPNSTPAPMLMTMKGQWMLMLHGTAFVDDIQQSDPRGHDKLFSTNWIMPMAQRNAGPGRLTLRAMLSLEPASITGERYPLLFQQGETAYGVPIVDGQHPHNLFMEIAALYDLHLGAKSLLDFYYAPVGDPALGPTAYPHRTSAAENPVAALGHHQQDSTHISYNVATVGLAHGVVRAEVSGFHGREPGENRWAIGGGAIDSWATRITIQPGADWSTQYSYARIASPEALFPTENQQRMTASALYNRTLTHGHWASTALWGRTRSLTDSAKENSYLLESTLCFATKNCAWTRIENAGRTNELLNGERLLPPGFLESPLTHVQAYTLGYDRDINLVPHIASALGAQVTLYGVGRPLQPVYGTGPVGVNVFLRLRVKPGA